jgi:hypothetical protein
VTSNDFNQSPQRPFFHDRRLLQQNRPEADLCTAKEKPPMLPETGKRLISCK